MIGIQPVCIVRIFDLFRIPRLTVENRSLHSIAAFNQVDALIVFQQIFPVVGNAEKVFQNIQGIFPLVFDIMDRKQRPNKLIFGAEAVNRFEIYSGQRSLPVMAMHDVGIKIQERHDLHYAAAEKGKTLAVVI